MIAVFIDARNLDISHRARPVDIGPDRVLMVGRSQGSRSFPRGFAMPVAVLPIVSLSEVPVSRIRAAVALSACPWAAPERSSRVRLTVATPPLKNALQTFKKAHKTQFPGAFTL